MWKQFILTIFIFLNSNLFGQTLENARVDSLFLNWTNPNEPGGAVGVLKNGKLIYSKGFGLADLEHNISISTTSKFYLASVSKQFTAFCILLLEEQGKINLNEKIQTYLPDFPKYESSITISDLIHHTSGLRDFSTLMDLQGKNYLDYISEKSVYDLIKSQKSLNFKPGQEYTYSNSGYFLLGLIIKKVAGKTLKEYADENIFIPLGMKNTTFLDDNKLILKNRVFSYGKNQGKPEFSNVIRRFDIVGSGGVFSTIEDLAIWDANFYDNKLGKGGQKIIQKMQEEVKVAKGSNSGYGFGLENSVYKGIKMLSHSGSNSSFRTFFARYPEQSITIIILANRSDVRITSKLNEVADIYLQNKTLPQKLEATTQKTISADTVLTKEQIADFSGKYFSYEINTHYEIKERNNKLILYVNDFEMSPFTKTSENILTNKDFGVFNFERNKRNKISGFKLTITRVRNLKFEKIYNTTNTKTTNR